MTNKNRLFEILAEIDPKYKAVLNESVLNELGDATAKPYEFKKAANGDCEEYIFRSSLVENQFKDNIKNEYCLNNKIQMLRIKYIELIQQTLETTIVKFLDNIKNN